MKTRGLILILFAHMYSVSQETLSARNYQVQQYQVPVILTVQRPAVLPRARSSRSQAQRNFNPPMGYKR